VKKETVFKIIFDFNILRHSVKNLYVLRKQMLCSRCSNQTLYIFVEGTRLIRPTIWCPKQPKLPTLPREFLRYRVTAIVHISINTDPTISTFWSASSTGLGIKKQPGFLHSILLLGRCFILYKSEIFVYNAGNIEALFICIV
jgi:hypothetical protein